MSTPDTVLMDHVETSVSDMLATVDGLTDEVRDKASKTAASAADEVMRLRVPTDPKTISFL